MENILKLFRDWNIQYEHHGTYIVYDGFYNCFMVEVKIYSEDEQKEIIKKIKNNCQN